MRRCFASHGARPGSWSYQPKVDAPDSHPPAPAQHVPDHLDDNLISVAPAPLAEELNRALGSPMNGRSTQPIWMPTNT